MREQHSVQSTATLSGKAVLAAVLLLLAAIIMSGCGKNKVEYSTPPAQKPASTATPSKQRGTKPYTVMGKTYYPILDASGYRETGVASWYGKDFHGRLTANGERYNMHANTAAHKLLPFGTQVKVTNLDNGKSIVTRINDRGPFIGNRIIDMSYAGARALGMVNKGTANVRVETVGAVKGLSTDNLAGNFFVQVGAFAQENNAKNLVNSIKRRGLNARTYYDQRVSFWRVQVGPYTDLNAAENAAESLRQDFPNNFVIAQ